MKKLILALLLMAVPFAVGAQTALTTTTQPIRFGYFSYERVLHSMSDYASAQHDMAKLRSQYDAEAKRSEDEFNQKYEAFLDAQRSLATSIREKRQSELLDMMEKNRLFKQESERLLSQAEADAMKPVRQRLAAAVKTLGRERGFAFVLNADGNSLPYVDPTMGEDVTVALIEALNK